MQSKHAKKQGFSVLFCRLYFIATSGVCLIRSGTVGFQKKLQSQKKQKSKAKAKATSKSKKEMPDQRGIPSRSSFVVLVSCVCTCSCQRVSRRRIRSATRTRGDGKLERRSASTRAAAQQAVQGLRHCGGSGMASASTRTAPSARTAAVEKAQAASTGGGAARAPRR